MQKFCMRKSSETNVLQQNIGFQVAKAADKFPVSHKPPVQHVQL